MRKLSLQAVADVYEANLTTAPNKAVMTHFDLPQRSATRWIARARAAGILRLKAGDWSRQEARLEAIAASVGTTAEDLRQALDKHSPGWHI